MTEHHAVAECLRQALPLMSRHGVAVTPTNYAVWYEYVSGENEALRLAMDELLADDGKVGDALTRQLHERFVAPPDDAEITDARETLARLVTRVGEDVHAADDGVSRYEVSLSGCEQRLQASRDDDELRTVLGTLADETRAMRQVSEQLHARLNESRTEIESLRRDLDRAKREARSDALTELHNRHGLREAYVELERESNSDNCLLIVDIDHFKSINDRFGHLVGDKVLRYVASTMKKCVKGRDTVSRYGGEEFVILLPETPLLGGLAVADQLRTAIEAGRLVRADTREPIGTVTVSIGVSPIRDGDSLDTVIGRADDALYRAKSEGRNRVAAEPAPEPRSSVNAA